MKKCCLLIMFSLITYFQQIQAQSPVWEWARATGGVEGRFISTDIIENVYLAGNAGIGLTSFGGIPFTCTGGINGCGYLVKYDSSGNFIWAKGETAPGSGYCLVASLHTDPFGNIYLGGTYIDTVLFDADTLISNTFAAFITKFDSAGNVLWAKTLSHTGYLTIDGIVTDLDGKIYTTGTFQSTQILGPDTLYNMGSLDCIIIKCDSSGNVIWAKSAGGINNEEGKSIAVDGAANVYITGQFISSSISFGTFTLFNPGLGRVPFLAKCDSSGNFKWGRIGNVASYNNGGIYVATDPSSNVYMGGFFYDQTISFDTITLIKSTGGSDAFIVKYDSSGNAIWAKSVKAVGTGNVGSRCIATDHFGRIYLTGFFGGSGLFDSTSALVDTFFLKYPTGANDPMFIAGYDTSGNVLFAKKLASGGDDENSISTGPSGAAYVGGDYMTTNMVFVVGNDTFPSAGEKPFLAKLIFPEISEGIFHFTGEDRMKPDIFPNPFDNSLQIQVKENANYEFRLFDLTSRVLIRKLFTGSTTIDTKSLTQGLYILEIKKGNDELLTCKVFKK